MSKNNFQFRYKQYSENAILIEGPALIDEILLQKLIFYKKAIENYYNEVIVEVILSYNSLLIYYRCTIEDVYNDILVLKSLFKDDFNFVNSKKRVWEIPVCYSRNLVPELVTFAALKSLTIKQIITLHTSPLYAVFFIGFLPGFLYLGGLDNRLRTPRKKIPDPKILKGSVAIGGDQTGVYPDESPGGWHVIGRSPLNFFDVTKQESCFVNAGDNIKFISISEKEYNDISLSVTKGVYLPKFHLL